jgi:lipoprotein NlpI
MGLAASPTDAYGVLWLYLSTSRADHSAHAGLEANAAKVKLTDWPGPVIQLYLGNMTTSEVLSAAADPDAQKNRELHCEAYFFLGEQALIAGRRIEAKRLFQQSIDTGVTSFVEYAGAQSELKRLQATPATGSH